MSYPYSHPYRRRWPRPDIDVEILQPVVTTNPNYPDEQDIDWSNPTVRETVKLSGLYPASEETRRDFGLETHRAVYEVFTDPVGITPYGRIRIIARDTALPTVAPSLRDDIRDGATFTVIPGGVGEWASYTRMVVERYHVDSVEEEPEEPDEGG